MSEKIFNQALQNFVSDVAYKKSVIHLYELGYRGEEIKKNCTYPVTEEQITDCIREYESKQAAEEKNYFFIEETDAYGRKSFRRVKR